MTSEDIAAYIQRVRPNCTVAAQQRIARRLRERLAGLDSFDSELAEVWLSFDAIRFVTDHSPEDHDRRFRRTAAPAKATSRKGHKVGPHKRSFKAPKAKYEGERIT